MGVFYIGDREERGGVFRRLCVGMILGQFFWEASRASPQHGWRSAYSLRETLSPTQDQNHIPIIFIFSYFSFVRMLNLCRS